MFCFFTEYFHRPILSENMNTKSKAVPKKGHNLSCNIVWAETDFLNEVAQVNTRNYILKDFKVIYGVNW